MLIRIDFDSENPIYMQLREQLIGGIARGELTPGETLPSVRRLAEDIGINLHTVNKTYNILKTEGYISIDRRKGSVINKVPHDDAENAQKQLKDGLQCTLSQMYCKGIPKEQVDKWVAEAYKDFVKGREN